MKITKKREKRISIKCAVHIQVVLFPYFCPEGDILMTLFAFMGDETSLKRDLYIFHLFFYTVDSRYLEVEGTL